MIAEVLHGVGYNVLEAADGKGGLDIVQSGQSIDLLMTDVGLPALNGRQLANVAREHHNGLGVADHWICR